MYRLIYAEEADRDLQAIYDYIAADSPNRAVQYLGKMEQAILQLQEFPNMGHESRYREMRALGVRILSFEDYLIFHTVNRQSETVSIVRVLHGSVDYKRLF